MKKKISLFVSICLMLLCFAANSTEAKTVSYDKAYAAKTLVVKEYPGTSYKTVGSIKVGSLVKVYGAVYPGWDQKNLSDAQWFGWSKIIYKNKYAYVITNQLKFANPYNWVPGVYSEDMNSIYNYPGTTKKDKFKLVKYGTINTQGIYVVYIQRNGKGSWQEFVNVNCKTGWYHG